MIEHGAFTIAAIQDEAALVIQKTWRGYRLRKSFQEQKRLLILHEKRRKETKMKQDENGVTSTREVKGRLAQQKSISDEGKFAEIFGRSFCQADENAPQGISSNDDVIYNHGQNNSSGFHNYLTDNEALENNKRGPILPEGSLLLMKDFEEQPQNEKYREDYSIERYDIRGKNRNNFDGKKDLFNRSQFEGLTSKMPALQERSNNIDSREAYTKRLKNETGQKISYNEHDSTTGHERNRATEGEENIRVHGTNGKVCDRLIIDNEVSEHRKTKNRTVTTRDFESSDRQGKLLKNRSISFSDNVNTNVIERTTKIFNALPTPSTSSSSLYSYASDADLKPWQIYRRERHRKHLIRRKIESAIVIQRAFRSHVSKQRSIATTCCDGVQTQNTKQGKAEVSDDGDVHMMQEIAALLIQLHWRKYLKKKLVKQQQGDKGNSDFPDSRYPEFLRIFALQRETRNNK